MLKLLDAHFFVSRQDKERVRFFFPFCTWLQFVQAKVRRDFTVASATKCGGFVCVTPISNRRFYLPGDMMGVSNGIQNSFLVMSDVCL